MLKVSIINIYNIILLFTLVSVFLLYNFNPIHFQNKYKTIISDEQVPEIFSKKSENFQIDIIKVYDGLSQVVVYVYQPPLIDNNATTIIVLHGVNKTAKEYCEYFIPFAEKYGLNIAAPLFDAKNYIKGDSNRPGSWSFKNAPRVFKEIIKNLDSKRYIFVGHSGGSQFLVRYMLKENITSDGIIAANAGTYAFPSTQIPWPYAFGEYKTWSKIFAQKVVLLLGEKDTIETGVLDVSDYANQQGANRLERGIKFYDICDRIAKKLNVPFKWDLHIVHETGHNAKKMFQSRQMEDALIAIIYSI
jgi:hypothetical protein